MKDVHAGRPHQQTLLELHGSELLGQHHLDAAIQLLYLLLFGRLALRPWRMRLCFQVIELPGLLVQIDLQLEQTASDAQSGRASIMPEVATKCSRSAPYSKCSKRVLPVGPEPHEKLSSDGCTSAQSDDLK